MLLFSNLKRQGTFGGLVIVTLLLIASVLRFYGVERQSMWADELFIVTLSHIDRFSQIIPQLLGDSHPPGYGTFMYFTLPVTGYDDWQVRLHSVIAGVLLVYITYRIGKRYLGLESALLAATLVTFSYNAIYYSQEARSYALLAASTMASVYFFLALFIAEEENLENHIGFIVSGILTVYLHYSGMVFIASEGLLALIITLSIAKKIQLKTVLIAFIPIAIAYAPWMPTMVTHMTGIKNYWGGEVDVGLAQFIAVGELISGPSIQFRNIMIILIGVSSLAALIKLYCYHKGYTNNNNPGYYATLLCLALLPILTFYLKSLTSQTVFQDRHFIYVIPLLSLICAYAAGEILAIIKTPYLKYTCLMFLCAAIGWKQFELNRTAGLYSTLTKDRIRDAVELMAEDMQFMSQQEKPVFSSLSNIFYHYQLRQGIAYTHMYEHYQTAENYSDFTNKIASTDANLFYYVGLGDPARLAFYEQLLSHHQLDCIELLQSKSGQVFVARFNRSMPIRTVTDVSSCRAILKNNSSR